MDDIIRMAHDAGMTPISHVNTADLICSRASLEGFAKLVAATERERIKWDTIHSCHPECDKPVCVAIRKAVAAEREKVADWMMARAYATGHGETTEELLEELGWQIEEKIAREREACALEVEKAGMEGYGTLAAAAAIRVRGQNGL